MADQPIPIMENEFIVAGASYTWEAPAEDRRLGRILDDEGCHFARLWAPSQDAAEAVVIAFNAGFQRGEDAGRREMQHRLRTLLGAVSEHELMSAIAESHGEVYCG